jgi:hypothetical protein
VIGVVDGLEEGVQPAARTISASTRITILFMGIRPPFDPV